MVPFSGPGLLVDLTPVSSSPEKHTVTNAETVTLTLTTQYPRAWETWFKNRLEKEGWAEGTQYALSVTDPASGPGTLVVTLYGPSGGAGNDLRFTFSHALVSVGIR